MTSSAGSGLRAGVRSRLRWHGALRHRNFRLFFSGQLISLVGTWMQSLAQSWLILILTHDPFWLGIVAAFQFLPVLLIGLFGGMVADVLPKRKTVIATQTASMILALILAFLSWAQLVQVWHILVLAALLGVVNAIDMPTRQSFTVEMVGREDVTNAVGLGSASFNAARIVGPAIGGILIGLLGVTLCFFVNGLSFIAVIVGLLLMRDEELRPVELLARPSGIRDVADNLAEGLRYVRVTPVVLLAVLVVGISSTFALNFNVIAPAYAQGILDVGATGLGFLMAAMGVGALMSALIVASFKEPKPLIIIAGAFGLGALEIVMGGIRSYPLALVAMWGAGFASIAMMISANTSIQLATPDRLRGRVMSVYTTVFAGSTPIGAPVVGWLASAYGTDIALVAGGLAAVVTAVGALIWVRREGVPVVAVGAVRRELARERGAGLGGGVGGVRGVGGVGGAGGVGGVSGGGSPRGSSGS